MQDMRIIPLCSEINLYVQHYSIIILIILIINYYTYYILIPILGARYAYYTHLLWYVSSEEIRLCRKDEKTGQFYLPKSVCIPGQIGKHSDFDTHDVNFFTI